jgi:hypothetical protein
LEEDGFKVKVSVGVRHSFEVTIGDELVWSGLEMGPPRTKKWEKEAIMEAVHASKQ